MIPFIEKSGLVMTDVEVLRLHYAETLKEWRRRFVQNWEDVRSLYDERFCRMWNFYLADSEAVFRYGDHVVYQVQLARNHEAVPLTRDYIYHWEQNGTQDQRPAAT
jgi:cyclopropane-fatty-acyl-phospholipid synthase